MSINTCTARHLRFSEGARDCLALFARPPSHTLGRSRALLGTSEEHPEVPERDQILQKAA
eukprot:9036122-Alexandrium_andersonii.AAC.1